MSWTISPQTKVPVDPQYGSVSLLLHGNGTNGSTTITDNSPSPKTVTAVGNAQISTAQSKFGGSSIAFDGTGDYLSIGNDTALALGSTWTIEFFVYLNTFGAGASRNGFISTGTLNTTGHVQIYSESGPTLIARCGGTGSNDATSGSSPFSAATWTHLAFVCNNLATTIYVNGSANGTGTLASASTVPITRIGNAVFADYDLDGYIDDLRITKGVARYTANFTPPAAPFPDI
jgi:hypothetical protein